jgi:diacylglycerol kinase (ATP)
MKTVKVLHNPKAGAAELNKKKLLKLLQTAGYRCSYTSTKKSGWDDIDTGKTDFVVLAGGDGTVRKVAKTILDLRLSIGLIPLGTANNIAKTLGVTGTPQEIIEGWNEADMKSFDVGRIYGLKDAEFFLEGMGFGIFPRLMEEMHKQSHKKPGVPEENLKTALHLLHDLILNAKARYCKISLDGADHSGKFLLAEVMNTQSIGPNLNLASFADPGDGQLDVILIAERQREEFAAYVHNKIHGIEEPPVFNVLKAKNLDIYWEGRLLHVDDEIIELKKPKEVRIKLQESVLKFMIPKKSEEEKGKVVTINAANEKPLKRKAD